MRPGLEQEGWGAVVEEGTSWVPLPRTLPSMLLACFLVLGRRQIKNQEGGIRIFLLGRQNLKRVIDPRNSTSSQQREKSLLIFFTQESESNKYVVYRRAERREDRNTREEDNPFPSTERVLNTNSTYVPKDLTARKTLWGTLRLTHTNILGGVIITGHTFSDQI